MVFGQLVDVLDIHHHIFRDIHIAKDRRDPEHIFHAAPGYRHLALVFCGHIHDLLKPVYIGGKGGDDDALVAAHEQLVEALPHLTLGVGMARLFHIGGITEQGKYPLVAQLPQTHKVDHAAGYGRNVDFEVAGVDHRAQWGADGHRVRDAVVHVDKFHGKAAQAKNGTGLFREYLGVIKQVMLLKLQLNQSGGERGGIDRNVQILQHIGYRADVVLVPMGQNQAPYTVRVGTQIADVRQNNVDAVHILVGKTHAAVHHNNVAAKLIGRHVLADLAKSSQGYNFQFRYHISSISLKMHAKS